MIGLILCCALVAVIAWCLLLADARLPDDADAVVLEVDALLPQSQCAQCGFPGCRPYAEAIVNDHAPINRCPPGGQTTVARLSELLGRPESPLDEEFGAHKGRIYAAIREAECIGCTFCVAACPVDAIVGAHLTTHTVIRGLCTGCELCIAPCPVDCIDLVDALGSVIAGPDEVAASNRPEMAAS
jgi:electron transport complex protein RnfB